MFTPGKINAKVGGQDIFGCSTCAASIGLAGAIITRNA